jgi:DNA repair exonuclease SbcCD ATPase subunit
MIPKSYSDDANLISSLLDDLELERKKGQQHARKNSSDSFSSANGNSVGRKDLSKKGDHLSENGGKKKQLKSGSSVAKTESFDTTSTTPNHEMNISPPASSSPSIKNKTRHVPLNRSPSVHVVAHGSEQLEVVVHSACNEDDTANSSCSKNVKTKTLTDSFETITHVFTTHMTAFIETKKKMDASLEKQIAQFANEIDDIKSKAEAEATKLLDQSIRKRILLEQQVAAANQKVDYMSFKIDELDQQCQAYRVESEDLKAKLHSSESYIDVRSRELEETRRLLQEQDKRNQHLEDDLSQCLTEKRELNENLEAARFESRILDEKLISTKEELSSKLDVANAEIKRLDGIVEEAHAKLVSLADAYKKQQRMVEAMEKNLEENAQEANDELKAVMKRCVRAESQNEMIRSENDKLKKKLEKMKDLYYGEVSKCNKAAEGYRMKNKIQI